MSKSLQNSIKELLDAGVISTEVAEKIDAYYKGKKDVGQNRLIIAFSMLGAILVGLGIILILAHNWDALLKPIKTVIAFAPLVAAQGLAFWVIAKRSDRTGLKEGVGAFLFFSVGISISLISQIYNISGDLDQFLLTWLALCFPVIYLLQSSTASLLFLIGSTAYTVSAGYNRHDDPVPYAYLLMIGIALPYYISLIRKFPGSNFTTFHHWFWAISLVISLGAFTSGQEEIVVMEYVALFAVLLAVSKLPVYNSLELKNNGFRIIGTLGLITLYMTTSFEWYWDDIVRIRTSEYVVLTKLPEFWTFVVLSLAFVVLLAERFLRRNHVKISVLEFSYLAYLVLFIIGLYQPVGAIIGVNALILGLGIHEIVLGGRDGKLGQVNFGLLVITALTACRFVDSDIPFVLRGILFVLVGLGFFAGNYFTLKRKKNRGS